MKDFLPGNAPGPGAGAQAVLLYRGADFQVVTPGAYVLCAVTGAPIELEALRYWSVERQEAYASPQAALEGHRRGR